MVQKKGGIFVSKLTSSSLGFSPLFDRRLIDEKAVVLFLLGVVGRGRGACQWLEDSNFLRGVYKMNPTKCKNCRGVGRGGVNS